MRTLRPLYHLLRADFLAYAYVPGGNACVRHEASGRVQRDQTTGGAR